MIRLHLARSQNLQQVQIKEKKRKSEKLQIFHRKYPFKLIIKHINPFKHLILYNMSIYYYKLYFPLTCNPKISTEPLVCDSDSLLAGSNFFVCYDFLRSECPLILPYKYIDLLAYHNVLHFQHIQIYVLDYLFTFIFSFLRSSSLYRDKSRR